MERKELSVFGCWLFENKGVGFTEPTTTDWLYWFLSISFLSIQIVGYCNFSEWNIV